MKTENIDKYTNMINEINSLVTRVGEELKENINQYLLEYPDVKEIRIRLNNHEFNDGEPTYFSLSHDDPTVVLIDGTELEYSYGLKENNDIRLLKIMELFRTYDIGDLYEDLYGQINESKLIFSR